MYSYKHCFFYEVCRSFMIMMFLLLIALCQISKRKSTGPISKHISRETVSHTMCVQLSFLGGEILFCHVLVCFKL